MAGREGRHLGDNNTLLGPHAGPGPRLLHAVPGRRHKLLSTFPFPRAAWTTSCHGGGFTKATLHLETLLEPRAPGELLRHAGWPRGIEDGGLACPHSWAYGTADPRTSCGFPNTTSGNLVYSLDSNNNNKLPFTGLGMKYEIKNGVGGSVLKNRKWPKHAPPSLQLQPFVAGPC